MRTIVFRGKVLYSQEWVYGSLEVFSDDNQQYARIKFDEPYTDNELGITIPVGHDYLVDPETVGQFTGLHDKNGKEIYEGDIMLFHGREYFAVWDEEETRFVFTNKTNNRLNPYKSTSEECFEVIGNIHDRKEETE